MRTSTLAVLIASSLALSGEALALTVPDTGTCSGSGTCLAITSSGGTALSGTGTFGATGVVGSSSTIGVGMVGSGYIGVQGTSNANGYGVKGVDPGTAIAGVYGTGVGGYGVYGTSTNNYAIYGYSPSQAGAYGKSISSYGVVGLSSNTAGVYGSGSPGVSGASTSNDGVSGQSSSGRGVYGSSTTGNGVWGVTSSTTNAATVGVAPSGGLAFFGQGGIWITESLAQKPGSGMWTTPSDRRIKKDVKDFKQGLAEVMKIRPIKFKYNGLGGTEDNGQEFVGVIAQDLEKVFPFMVSSHRGKLRKDDTQETEIERVDPSAFTYVLINAVQEQQKVIQQQNERIGKLERMTSPMASSMIPLGVLGAAGFLGLIPVGLVVAYRRRKKAA